MIKSCTCMFKRAWKSGLLLREAYSIILQAHSDSWYRIAWAFLKVGGVRQREGGRERGEGETSEMRDGEGMNSEGKYVGKKCRLQLYQYPKGHKFASGISEVSIVKIYMESIPSCCMFAYSVHTYKSALLLCEALYGKVVL